MANPLVQFRADPSIVGWLEGRPNEHGMPNTSPGEQARAELMVWISCQMHDLRTMPPLTVDEWCCVADVMNGTMISQAVGSIIFAELVDAFAPDRFGRTNSYGEKWGVDQGRLAEWAASLSASADYAVRCALARWWEDTSREPDAASFTDVGLPVAAQDRADS